MYVHRTYGLKKWCKPRFLVGEIYCVVIDFYIFRLMPGFVLQAGSGRGLPWSEPGFVGRSLWSEPGFVTVVCLRWEV